MANKPVRIDPLVRRDIRSAKRWYRKQSVDEAEIQRRLDNKEIGKRVTAEEFMKQLEKD